MVFYQNYVMMHIKWNMFTSLLSYSRVNYGYIISQVYYATLALIMDV